ncbi:MAG: membrane protein [Marinobacter sp. T13-3]|nr:MAG: membrane protein [Marinobacter sp. T13-3]
MAKEKMIWKGRPSQVVNLGTYLLMTLLIWLVFPLFIMIWKWLVVRNTQYALTTERLRTRHGVLNKRTDDLELYRVRDYRVERPFFLRLFGLGNLIMDTSDTTHPTVTIQAIPNAEALSNKLRRQVEHCRMQKNVREVDFA